MVSEVGWKTISNNNLNWTSDASAGKAMFGELRWLGVWLLRCGCRSASDFRRLVRDLLYKGGVVAWNIVADLLGTLLPNLLDAEENIY